MYLQFLQKGIYVSGLNNKFHNFLCMCVCLGGEGGFSPSSVAIVHFSLCAEHVYTIRATRIKHGCFSACRRLTL